jgi:hypothetical protein
MRNGTLRVPQRAQEELAMRRVIGVSSFSLVALAMIACSGTDGRGLIGADERGGASDPVQSSEELVEKPSAPAPAGSVSPQDKAGEPSSPAPAPAPTPAPTATDAGTQPPPPPQPYYRLTLGSQAQSPLSTPEARRDSRNGGLEVHAVLTASAGLAPEESFDVEFPKDGLGSFACDSDHRAVWVRPDSNKITARIYVSKPDASCKVEITRIDQAGGWVEGSATGTLAWTGMLGQTDTKTFAVVFRVPRTQ